jgi:hypothetical protein
LPQDVSQQEEGAIGDPQVIVRDPVTCETPSESYVPFRKNELIDLLLASSPIDATAAGQFRRLCDLIEIVVHHEFHSQQEHLKNLYAPFDPDSSTRPLKQLGSRARLELTDELIGFLANVLNSAHYHPLGSKELEYALSGATYWGLDLQINRDIFERLIIYVRGHGLRSRVHRDFSTWLRRRSIDLEIYERLVIVVKLRREFVTEGIDPDNVYVKLFRDIPKLDLEMLLPGTRPRIRLLDAGKIGGSSVTGIFSLGKMVMESIILGKLKWLMLAVGALVYAAQSFLGYRRTKAAYVYSMTQQLYYQNLDNNLGAFCRLIDEAEDEETKEAVLAYFFLWTNSTEDWTPPRLGAAIAKFIRGHTGSNCEFDAHQAIAKLQRLGILTSHQRRLDVVPPSDAIRDLSQRWTSQLGVS